jgi:hypothetical protein
MGTHSPNKTAGMTVQHRFTMPEGFVADFLRSPAPSIVLDNSDLFSRLRVEPSLFLDELLR